MHFFAAPLHPGQQTTHSLRVSQYKRPKKRKRDEDTDDEEDAPISFSQEAEGPAPTSNTPTPASSGFSLAAPDVSQRRVAGLLPGDEIEIPPMPFPHAPTRSSRDNFTYTNMQSELASLDPPLFALTATSRSGPVDRPTAKPALRQTHLGILTTLLHHCLLKGDYHRAGRAWGMILRTQVAGKPLDLRSHDRWGIGAELLFQRSAVHSTNGNSSGNEIHMFTPEGFEQARYYYERLIVQYPYRKQHPNSIDEATFYPAMFSFWVYEVCEKNKRARRRIGCENQDRQSVESTLDVEVSEQEEEVRNEELRQATEICERLDKLITSPPFDKRADLLQLRGMLGLWKADLIEADSLKDDQSSWDETQQDNLDFDPTTLRRYIQCRTELQAARNFLIRAHENGAPAWKSLKDIDVRIRKLAEKMQSAQKF
jgi:hypothetical protein